MNDEEIFHQALAQNGPEELAAYLEQACGSDSALRASVEALLRANIGASGFMDRPIAALLATVDDPISERTGTFIESYKLMEQIGEGGMGLVFVAEQQQPVRRKVALKVIKPGMDTRQVVARFEAERQALALMDHPNIAKVHDGGTTASGRPYFVMELVKGVPITAYCDQNQVPIRQRLELFVSVCQAVQHAHQKGIIHRDLKPSNVLVVSHDGTPVVKVIDFGVAKAIGQQLTDKTIYTQFSQMVGTPLYMSPEQAGQSGLDVDTRSDIYALGVLLYELLTGTTPFDKERMRDIGYDEMRRIIREEEPPKPSTRISTLGKAATTLSTQRQSEPKQLSRLIRGELDWIVMKALEKDRNRRYETASALATDVQRYLNDEPVQACPPSAWYRFRKLARRNKAMLATATAVALAVFLAVGSLVGAVKVLADNNAQIEDKQQQTSAALQREKQARADLIQSIDREARTSYYRSVQLAERELAANNIARADELLDDCPLRLRGWEWHYLERRPYGPLTFRAPSRVVFSSDGKHIAWVNEVGDLTLGDRASGWKARRVLGNAWGAFKLAFSLDGKYLAGAGWDRTIRVWDIAAGKEVRSLSGHTDAVASLAFSPDGKLLASASWDHTVIVWDAATFEHLLTLRGHSKGINAIAFAANGRLASASSDETIRVWEARTGQELHTLRGHSGPVMDVAFSRAGRLASAGFDGSVKLWDAAAGRNLATIRADITPLFGVAFSPDGQRLAAGGLDRSVRIWDPETQEEALTLHGHEEMVVHVTFSPDGQQLVSMSKGGTVKVWDTSPSGAGSEAITLRGHGGAALAVAFLPDSQRLASAGTDETVRLWNAATGEELAMLRSLSGPVVGLSVSRDGQTLASTSFGGLVQLWDVQTRKKRRELRGFAASVALSPDGTRVASASVEGWMYIWNAVTGKEEIPPFRGHVSSIAGLALSPDGKRLASTSMDGTAKVWDATTGRQLLNLKGHSNIVHGITFDGDGKRLATASWDRTSKVWDAATGKELLTLRGHDDRVLGVAFSPDGKRLATASWDSTAKVWDAKTGQDLATLHGHSGYVFGVAFSPDGKLLASAGGYRSRGEVKVWDSVQWAAKPGR